MAFGLIQGASNYNWWQNVYNDLWYMHVRGGSTQPVIQGQACML